MKKIITFGLVCLILLTCSIAPCYAYAGEPSVQPMWDNISTINLYLSFSGTSGEASVIASKKSGVTSIEGTLTVYENEHGEY